MWQDLFTVEIPVLEKILRTIAVYLLVMIIFRIIGKRAISAMTTVDFVLLLLLSNVVQNAIIGADNSLWGGTIGAVTLVAASAGFDWLALHNSAASRVLVGRPTTVIKDGKVDPVALAKIGLREAQLEILVHEQDGDDLSQIDLAFMEPDGHVVVRLKKEEQTASRADIAALNARLDRIEALLRTR
jgi:uncharacterized membrane protein YcaP (DUF421 family)